MLTHRYLGVGVGALMLLWCLSGVVMLFVHWPEVREDQRVAGLAAIGGAACCRFGATIGDAQTVEAARVESAAGRPVLRLDGQVVIDLTTGAPVEAFSAADARAISQAFAPGAAIAAVTAVDSDQWTVTGYFNARRPFWRVRLGDPARTELYVSAKTGEVSQRTTAAGRLLNWAGAIPHWLYPAVLRAHTKLWAQVVIWTSVLGTFLTLAGLYLGLVAWRPAGDGRASPYRGLMTWHHLTGLATGILTLTWVVSGLLSMNPWGLLGSGPDKGAARLAGGAHAFAEVREALTAAVTARPDARQIRTAPFAGSLYLMADGERLDARGRRAALSAAELALALERLGPVAAQDTIAEEDAYYFAHHAPVTLPVRRVVLTDGTRYYLDPGSGEVLQVLDAPARGYRWLHLGLHRLDIIPGLRQGAGWAAAMVILLAGVTLGVGLGVWLAWRRAMHDLAGWRRNRLPSR
ncbi:PepSY domain-containing protein [Phenylobacterium sp.]|uniref:PepSY domain-containing protein n=1 Tax=Phenylobacterium sp. TaxID=1871053 RepID=UPI0039839101